MITKEKILTLITEEKELYNKYSELCAHYKISPDKLVVAKHSSIVETLEMMIKMLQKH